MNVDYWAKKGIWRVLKFCRHMPHKHYQTDRDALRAHIDEGAAEIRGLQAEVEAMRKGAERWIDLDNARPEPEVFVLAWDGERVSVDWFGSLKRPGGTAYTHWLPFPKPPGAGGMYGLHSIRSHDVGQRTSFESAGNCAVPQLQRQSARGGCEARALGDGAQAGQQRHQGASQVGAILGAQRTRGTSLNDVSGVDRLDALSQEAGAGLKVQAAASTHPGPIEMLDSEGGTAGQFLTTTKESK